MILEDTGTNVIEPGWEAEVQSQGNLVLTHVAKAPVAAQDEAADAAPDPVRLEIFNNLFQAIAQQMGVTLQNTSSSVNIKERLDFSCAIFDADGQLIANAPHIPVHLGSMGESSQSPNRRPKCRAIAAFSAGGICTYRTIPTTAGDTLARYHCDRPRLHPKLPPPPAAERSRRRFTFSQSSPLLRRLTRTPRRHRRHYPRLYAPSQHPPLSRRHPARQPSPRQKRHPTDSRVRTTAHPVPPSRSQLPTKPCRPPGPNRRQQQRHPRTAKHRPAVWPRHRSSIHESRPKQRRASRPQSHQHPLQSARFLSAYLHSPNGLRARLSKSPSRSVLQTTTQTTATQTAAPPLTSLGTSPQQPNNFNRPPCRLQGRCPLCLSHPRGHPHPPQRWLSQAARYQSPQRLAAQSDPTPPPSLLATSKPPKLSPMPSTAHSSFLPPPKAP